MSLMVIAMDAPKGLPSEVEIDFLKLRDTWIDFVNRRSTISHASARVGTFIALRMNAKERASWWPVDKIARETGCSTKTVSEAVASLEKEKLLVVTRKKRGGNSYSLRLPFEVIT